MALEKGFMDDFGDAIVNFAFMGVLCIFGIQDILGKQWLSIGILSIWNLDLRSLIFLLIMESGVKLFIQLYVFVVKLLLKPNSFVITEV